MFAPTLLQRLLYRHETERITRRDIGWCALVIAILTAGTYNSFAKILSDALSPLSLLFLSESLTLLFVLLTFGFVPTLKRIMRLSRETYVPLLALSVCNGFLAPLLIFAGLHRTSAVNATFFSNAEMVFFLFLAMIVLREPLTRRHGFSVSVIIAGMVTIALHGFTKGLSAFQAGDALIILGACMFSCGSIIYRHYLHHVEPQIAMCARSTFAIASLFILSPFVQHPLLEEIQAFPLELVPALIGFGFLSRFLNVFSFYESLENLPVSTVSLFFPLSVIISVLFAHLYLGEAIFWYDILGGSLIILGAFSLQVLGVHPSEEHLERHMKHRLQHV